MTPTNVVSPKRNSAVSLPEGKIFTLRASPEQIKLHRDPFGTGKDMRSCLVDVSELLALEELPLSERVASASEGLPLEANLRKPITSKVYLAICETLKDSPALFHLKNRGLYLSCEKCWYDNRSNTLSLHMTDFEMHGILDGGHSYQAIREEAPREPGKAFVKIFIYEGINDLEEYVEICTALNTSRQVSSASVAEKLGYYEDLQKALGEELTKKVAWFDGDVAEGGKKKEPVENVLAELSIFLDQYLSATASSSESPTRAYSSKGSIVEEYAALSTKEKKSAGEFGNPYRAIFPLAGKILAAHEYIQRKFPDKYNEADDDGKGGKFGRTKVSKAKKRQTSLRTGFLELVYPGAHSASPLHGKAKKQKIPHKGLTLPVLGALRAIVARDKNGEKKFLMDPYEFLEKHGTELFREAVDLVGRNDRGDPQKAGKNPSLWQALYKSACLAYLQGTSPTK